MARRRSIPETSGTDRLNFHYSREERLREAGRGEPEPRKPFFKRNRSLLIVLLDIVIIVIMFVLLQFVFKPGTTSKRVDGVSYTLTAFEFDGEVYATVTMDRFRELDSVPENSDVVSFRFADGSEIRDIVPDQLDAPVQLRRVYPVDSPPGDPLAVSVSVATASNTFNLATTIDRE